ncbi:MAG: S41 family peptidase [Peptoniphilus sp.]|uniref:S41 family peptidase n=1 Tax=Peptoniphilus sp. TaxID=1971214 RepID=UPI002A7580CF|nr:S41 family peptidase [Peptoniphilus sp.]MDY2987149.1 S41 family peptidase [Peptoniphilus sp.]
MKYTNKSKLIAGALVIVIGASLWLNKDYFTKGNAFPNLPRVEQTVTTTEDYLADFDYAYEVLKETYPYFEVNKIKSGVDWLANRDKYRAEIAKSKSASDFYNKMNLILGDLHNGHTQMIDEKIGFNMYMLMKSYHIKPEDKLYYYIEQEIEQFESPKVRARYHINNDSIKKALENGNRKDFLNNIVRNGNISNVLVGDIKNDIGYIKINAMQTDMGVEEDKKIILPYLEKIKDYKALVIDLRGNGGGDDSYYLWFLYPNLIDKSYTTKRYNFIKSDFFKNRIENRYDKLDNKILESFKFPLQTKELLKDFKYYMTYNLNLEPNDDSIRFKGKIYLLVDRGVYSAAEAMASFSKESGLATLIGERTGGDGIGENPRIVALNKTGYMIRYSYNLGVTESGSVNELEQTTPDIVCDPSTSGALIDQPCIKEVLKLESN